MAQNAGATARELVGEAVGTVLLLAGIIGSGILAQELSGELTGLALFMHAASVGGLLVVLVLALGPVSGAHFNPAVTIAFWMDGKVSAAKAAAYIGVQVIAALIGVAVAHLSFNLDPFIPGVQARTGTGVWIGEVVATFSLVFAIFMIVRVNVQSIAPAVGLIVMAAIMYTSSTCFANPAVTIARAFTDTFTSIRPIDVAPYVMVQLLTAIAAQQCATWLLADQPDAES